MRFIKRGAIKIGPRAVIRDLTLIAGLVFINIDWTLFSIGIIIFLIGASLHLWSKSCLVRNAVVTICGPYRLVRHPFYLANIIIDIGLCFISGNLYLLAAYIPLSLLTYTLTLRKEEKYLKGRHGDEYIKYAKDTPALFPYKIHRIFGPLDATWQNVRKEHEVPRLLRILSLPLVFLIVHYLYESRLDAFRRPLVISIVAVALLLTIASQLIMYRIKRQKDIGKEAPTHGC